MSFNRKTDVIICEFNNWEIELFDEILRLAEQNPPAPEDR